MRDARISCHVLESSVSCRSALRIVCGRLGPFWILRDVLGVRVSLADRIRQPAPLRGPRRPHESLATQIFPPKSGREQLELAIAIDLGTQLSRRQRHNQWRETWA